MRNYSSTDSSAGFNKAQRKEQYKNIKSAGFVGGRDFGIAEVLHDWLEHSHLVFLLEYKKYRGKK